MPAKKSTAVAPHALNPALVALKTRATSLIKKWSSPIVKTAEQFESAGLAVKDFASLRKELKSILDPEIKEAKAIYDSKRDAYKVVDSFIGEGESAIREALEAYTIAHRKAAEAKIEKAIAMGNDVQAAAIAAKPYIPAVEGLSFTERWHGEVTDIGVFLTAVLDGRIPQDAIEVSFVWLNAQARARKAEDIGVPGAKGVKETSSSVRT
jgi:hypothetical protein